MAERPSKRKGPARSLTRSAALWVVCLGLFLPPLPPRAEEIPGPPARPDAVAAPGAVASPDAAPADPRRAPAAEAALFAMPEIAAAGRTAAALAEAGDPGAATALLQALGRAHPDVGTVPLLQAELALLLGDPEAALAPLAAAAALGTDPGPLLADPALDPLGDDPRLQTLLAAPRPAALPDPVPAAVVGSEALVSGANTAWDPETERLVARFAFPARASAPVLPARPKAAALDILREHWKRGRAAGNRGDVYDNRDRNHSLLPLGNHPQLARTIYSEAARAADLDYGLADRLLIDAPTFGNSSTALTGGALWRSLPRAAMTAADGMGPLRLWQNASANQLYVYPAHKDYTPELGDLFPANTPYVLVSRGSSGSDQPFLEAIALILAAFRPATKERLIAEDLIVPTVQMVFRRSLHSVTSRADYMGGPGARAAFAGGDINAARMVSLANAIKPDTIPPQVRLRVLEEDLGTEGVDFFGEGLSEQLFDTPAAIARIWRTSAGRRSILVTATDTTDPNGHPLTFTWKLMQGDPKKVTITPLGDGATARITLDWHDPFPVSKDDPTRSSRIDIGVFANNGTWDSAPAILSWYCPPGERRTYAPAPKADGAPRLVAIDRSQPVTDREPDPETTPETGAAPDAGRAPYNDPLLVPQTGWRDRYTTDDTGRVTGWTRDWPDEPARAPEDFTALGARILDRGANGAPDSLEAVAYPLTQDPAGRLVVSEVRADPSSVPANPPAP